jgi:cysteine synthase A
MVEAIDTELLNEFKNKIASRLPAVHEVAERYEVINATPLVDLTRLFLECARLEYGFSLDTYGIKVYGKLDSMLPGGSVKTRAAAKIVEQGILSGRLKKGQVVFEATSGNFGISLGLLTQLGFKVVVLVSRRIKEGVIRALEKTGVQMINLDVDICPAPGVELSDYGTSSVLFDNLQSQLRTLGFDTAPLKNERQRVETLLARQDVINLAKLLAEIYGGYCPEQYDNDINAATHEVLTGPELDAQLRNFGEDPSMFRFVCTFGTGGTSTGLSRYLIKRYGKKLVHVIFPLSNQDVAGIRSKDKAAGLKFYQPSVYAGEHELDFEAAKRLLRFFLSRGVDIGESSALALWGAVNLANFGVGNHFVVMLADGASKYIEELRTESVPRRLNISLDEALTSKDEITSVVWTHPSYVPRQEGLSAISSVLGVEESKVKVMPPDEVRRIIYSGEFDGSLLSEEELEKGKVLLVCIGGGNSLRMAEILSKKGVKAFSLDGGLMSISNSRGLDPRVLIRPP